MKLILIFALAMTGCSDKESDSANLEPICPGDSIHVEVCIECGEAGGCEETETKCRSICDAVEDCPDGYECNSSDEGNYCHENLVCF